MSIVAGGGSNRGTQMGFPVSLFSPVFTIHHLPGSLYWMQKKMVFKYLFIYLFLVGREGEKEREGES